MHQKQLRQVGNRKVILEQKQRQAEEALPEATYRLEEIQQELEGAIAELNAATVTVAPGPDQLQPASPAWHVPS